MTWSEHDQQYSIEVKKVAKKYNLDIDKLDWLIEAEWGYEWHDDGYTRAVIRGAIELRKQS